MYVRSVERSPVLSWGFRVVVGSGASCNPFPPFCTASAAPASFSMGLPPSSLLLSLPSDDHWVFGTPLLRSRVALLLHVNVDVVERGTTICVAALA